MERVEVSLNIGRHQHTVIFETNELHWTRCDKNDQGKTVVTVADILSITTSAGDATSSSSLRLCYATRQAKDVLRQKTVVFTGDNDNCVRLVECVQESITTAKMRRPKRMLVVLSPVSGHAKGRQLYQNTVAPIFKEAGIQTDVRITERSKHAIEIVEEYDLTTIDSLVTVGGDGMYHEASNVLLKRRAIEMGINLNDADAELPDVPITVGIIPTGTGNGIAKCCYGNDDVETAALAIATGTTRPANLYSVRSAGEFLTFAIVLVQCGFSSDLRYTTNERILRWGRFRILAQLYSALESLFKPSRVSNLVMDFKRSQPLDDSKLLPAQRQGGEGDKDGIKTGTSVDRDDEIRSGWETKECDCIAFLMAVPLDECLQKNKVIHAGCSDVGTIKPSCTTFQLVRLVAQMFKLDYQKLLQNEVLDHTFCTELRLKLKAPSDPESVVGKMERLLDVDGEIFTLKQPEIHVKIHTGGIQLYTSVKQNCETT